jgi:hypothetical protein
MGTIRSQGIDRFGHTENNVGAGLSEDFAKISKHQIKTRPPQPKSSTNRSDAKIAKNPLINEGDRPYLLGFIDRDEFDEGQVFI